MNNVKEIDSKYIAGTYGRFPVEIVRGKGDIAVDSEGREYIDLSSGIAVNTFGHADDEWIKAVTEQINLFSHTSNLYYSAPCAHLAEILCERTGMSKVFFSNSGAESNECAIKVAREYAANAKGSEFNTIITLKNSFHGRTITTLAATGQDTFHQNFLPLTEGFVYAEANNAASVEKLAKEHKCAAVMMEMVQGEGGVNPLDKEFVAEVVRIAKENDLLIVLDEVQTGNGRTGKLYAYMNYDIIPDIVTTAKGLAGGLPIGATLLGDRVKDVLKPGMHGSTCGGNPVSCAAAISVISRIDDALLEDVRKKSAYVFEALSDADGVQNVSGMGLMIGIKTDKPAPEVIAACREKGVLVISAKDKVRLLPPLNISFDNLKKAVEVIKEACR